MQLSAAFYFLGYHLQYCVSILFADRYYQYTASGASYYQWTCGFLTDPDKFWGLAVFLDVWKEMGWWTIIFLAAITGISNDYYEAAQIDGASRMQRILFITLPCIKSTIVVVLIMTMGNLFGGGLSGSNFEQSYLLGNSLNAATSDIIQTYVFDVGLSQGRYAYATAVGLIQSVISLILIFVSNFASKKMAGSGLF